MDKQRDDSELIQYYIVNTDLKMTAGKIAAQCAHGSMLIALRDQQDEKFIQWKNIAMKKVVLGGSLEEIKKIHEKIPQSILIIDNGLTEIEPNSETVLTLPVLSRQESRPIIGHLRLLFKI